MSVNYKLTGDRNVIGGVTGIVEIDSPFIKVGFSKPENLFMVRDVTPEQFNEVQANPSLRKSSALLEREVQASDAYIKMKLEHDIEAIMAIDEESGLSPSVSKALLKRDYPKDAVDRKFDERGSPKASI